MTDIIRALRLFHYDPKWRVQRRGKKPMHKVPMRALAKISGVSYIQIYKAVLTGHLSDNAEAKLLPFVISIMNGDGRFEYVARKGYVFLDGTLERIGRHASQ